ncbi:MAG: baseplate tail-tube junction protein, partial [Psychroserpens sp.]|nr:baseplate tail-tube junction protein [Psychroserpens sp.]
MARSKDSSTPLRYPLSRIDDQADYLVVRVNQYKPPRIDSNSRTPFLQNTSNKIIEQASRNGRVTPLETIYLPIPQNLIDENSVKWNEDQLDSLSRAAFGGVRDFIGEANLSLNENNAISLIGTAGERAASAFKALDDNVRGVIRDRLIAGAVNSLGANVNPNTLVSRETGQVLNPNLQLLFQGVNLKNYNFVFTMTPRSAEESRVIKKIIRTFKRRLAAKTTTSANQGAAAGIFIKAPDIFEMEFKKGGNKHPFLFSMKPAALKKMRVNYENAGPYATYEDGTPLKIEMV